ncbi:MAG: hypothetical protein ACRCZF_24865 [Gemmataceae bacterium]
MFVAAYATIFIANHMPMKYELPMLRHAKVDRRILKLYEDNVLTDQIALQAAINDIWLMYTESRADYNYKPLDVQHLLPFLLVSAPNVDYREMAVMRGAGSPVIAIVVYIGMPAVGPLLHELERVPDVPFYRNHRWAVANALVAIYDQGGGGKELARERIKMYAQQPFYVTRPHLSKRILASLDTYPFVEPQSAKDDRKK